MEETTEERDDAPESEFPTKTALILLAVVAVAAVGIFFWYAKSLNQNPEKECAFRGGTWIAETEECVFEGGVTGKNEQVGMVLDTLTLRIPDMEDETAVPFENLEIGRSREEQMSFAISGSPSGGAIWLSADLGRVHKETEDLIMPFAVNFGGSGTFTYVGIFEKKDGIYIHRDSVPVGDRIGVEGLVLSPRAENESYTAKLSYRDRREGEPMAQTPTEPRTLEITVYNHQSDTAYMLSREGLHYKDVVKVSAPLLRASVASPLVVKGEARGNWYFEASFPLALVDWDGKIIAEGHAEAEGEWMTGEYVPFTGTLTFTVPEDIPYRRGVLILKKDNPSGLPENDDAFEIPVVFE